MQDSTLVTTSSADQVGSNGDNYLTDPQLYGMPLPSNKYRDYFTSCLPAPQKGESVPIPFSTGQMPVKTIANPWEKSQLNTENGIQFYASGTVPIASNRSYPMY